MNANFFQPVVLLTPIKLNSKFHAVLVTIAMVLLTAISSIRYAEAQGTPISSEQGFVYTANERGNSVSVIDLRTGQVKNVPLRISPHNVQISHDGRLLFIVGMVAGTKMADDHSSTEKGSNEKMPRGRLLIFDAATMSNDSMIDIEVGQKPAHVIADREGKLAYVSNGQDNTVSVIDIAQRKVIGEIKSGKSPHGLRMSPNAKEIYVANTGDDSVSVIDVVMAREVASVRVGKAPAQVAFTPDGQRIYVTSTVDNAVMIVDTKRRIKIGVVAVGRKPIQVFATPDGRYIYAANEGKASDPDNTASVIDTATNKVVATVVTGKGAHGVVVTDDGSRALIANTVDNTVSVIDTATQRVTRSIKVGEGSGGITFRNAR